MVSPILKIGGVDVSEHFKSLTVSPVGPGAVGRGDLALDKEAGGLTITNMMPVQLYIPFNAAGAGVAARGRLFAGFISNRNTGTIATTKLWQIACQDWNLILDKVVRDAAPAYSITITSADFDSQILQVVQILQFNGSGVVNTQIDAVTKVANLVTSAMPALQLPPGKKLRYYIQQICNSAVAIDPTINPRFFMDTSDTFGVGDVFGVPTLNIYDANLEPAPAFVFDEDNIYGQFNRVLETSQIDQRLQSVWGPGSVAVYEESASQVLYPNPYINHGETGNTGFWMSEPVADTESVTNAQAVAALTRTVKARAYPRETISFGTYEYVRPGDVVDISWDLEGLAKVIKRVVGVTYSMEGLDLFVAVTVNARRLLLGEEGEEGIDAPPEEGDPVPPDPPGTPTTVYNTYDMILRQTRLGIAFTASPSGDVTGYIVHWQVGTEEGRRDIGDNLTAEIVLDPSVSVDIEVWAYDSGGRESAPSGTLTVTTAAMIGGTLINPDFEVKDPHIAGRADGWTPTNNDGTVTHTNLTSGSGLYSQKFVWTAGATPPNIVSRLFLLSDQHKYFINALAKASSSDALGLNLPVTFYDSALAVISTDTAPVLTTLTTSWVRKNARNSLSPPAGTRYASIQVKPAGAARAVDWWIDDIQFYWQLPGDGVEDGAINDDQIGVITLPEKLQLRSDGTNEGLNLYDAAGALIFSGYYNVAGDEIVLNADIAGKPIRIHSGLGAQLTLDAEGTFNDKMNANHLGLSEITAPGTPAAGNVNVYAKADGLLYSKDDAGVETPLGNAGTVTGVTATTPIVSSGGAAPNITHATSGVAAQAWKMPNLTTNTTGHITVASERAGTAFPGSPANNDFFYRTDLGVMCRYISAISSWVGPPIYLEMMKADTAPTYSVTTIVPFIVSPPDAATYYMERVSWRIKVATTNSASHYWVYRIGCESQAGGTGLLDVNSSLETVGVMSIVEGTGFPYQPLPFTEGNQIYIWIEIRKDVGSPGPTTIEGCHLTLYKVYT